jgi:hypothetical protein
MTRVNQHDACVATLEFFNRILPQADLRTSTEQVSEVPQGDMPRETVLAVMTADGPRPTRVGFAPDSHPASPRVSTSEKCQDDQWRVP